MIRYVLFVSTQKSEQYVGSTSSICTPSSFFGRHFNRFHCQPQKKIKFSHFLYQCTIEYSYKEAKRNEKKIWLFKLEKAFGTIFPSKLCRFQIIRNNPDFLNHWICNEFIASNAALHWLVCVCVRRIVIDVAPRKSLPFTLNIRAICLQCNAREQKQTEKRATSFKCEA